MQGKEKIRKNLERPITLRRCVSECHCLLQIWQERISIVLSRRTGLLSIRSSDLTSTCLESDYFESTIAFLYEKDTGRRLVMRTASCLSNEQVFCGKSTEDFNKSLSCHDRCIVYRSLGINGRFGDAKSSTGLYLGFYISEDFGAVTLCGGCWRS